MALAQLLCDQNFPAVAIHRAMNQEERLSKYQEFKDFQKVKYSAINKIYFYDNFFKQGVILILYMFCNFFIQTLLLQEIVNYRYVLLALNVGSDQFPLPINKRKL